ncbi:hypothetical protein PHMEG_00021063 [Phytophthora megakarya]|uniref:Uncharacterized protein n=1 Tax=Phytophthora megakarya TaxID=4795 RepID=A0A225VNH7_9STRA|nr:hypothetical protein PHMEG_00021063 [Phytophthora megakarya]
MVNDIPRAVTTLLYKNIHLPAEDEAEFEGEVTKKPASEEANAEPIGYTKSAYGSEPTFSSEPCQ